MQCPPVDLSRAGTMVREAGIADIQAVDRSVRSVCCRSIDIPLPGRTPLPRKMDPAVHNDTFQTKSSRVYGELKRGIISGSYKSGEHLVRRDLVKKFGV